MTARSAGFFWSFVDASDDLTACWLWKGTVDRDGYGVFGNGRAHRIVLAEKLGRPLRRDEVARHACDTPACCNPNHLVEGTQIENVADRVLRRRSATGRVNGRNVLNESQALAVFLSEGSLATIAACFNVSKWTVRDIKAGRIWAWLTGPLIPTGTDLVPTAPDDGA